MFSVTVLNNRETTCGFWALDMGPLWLKTWISKFYIIVCIVKAMVFPVFMYGCEIWPIKKAECWRTDAFELWHWKRLLCSFDSKQIKPINPKENQSWLFIGRTDAEAETPNTLATWCEKLTPWKRHWCWERLKVGGEGDDRGWDVWMASPTWWTWVWTSSRSWCRTGMPGVL